MEFCELRVPIQKKALGNNINAMFPSFSWFFKCYLQAAFVKFYGISFNTDPILIKQATFILQMKKAIIAILAFIYLFVSSGVAMEIHYCMGKKAGVELYGSGNEKCEKCGMKEKKGGCCSDEHKFYKLSDSHKNVSNELSFSIPSVFVETVFPSLDVQNSFDIFTSELNNHSPPDYSAPPACILNCIFRL
jgi:hypothetical protein